MEPEVAAPSDQEQPLEGAAPRPQLRLNFPLEPGTEICLITTDQSLVDLPYCSARIPEGKRLVSEAVWGREMVKMLDAGAPPFSNDLLAVGRSIQFLLRTGATFKILEVGQGDQEGLVKLSDDRHPESDAFWVEARNLQDEWQVNLREGKPLTGDRLDEICDLESKAVLRRTDDVRRLMIALLGSRGQEMPS